MNYKHFVVVMCAVSLLCAAPNSGEYEKGRLVVQHRKGSDKLKAKNAIESNGGKTRKKIDALDLEIIDVPEGAADAIASKLEKSGLFNFVERDYLGRGSLTPNDPSFGSQWHLNNIQAASAWNMTTGSGVTIAVIDSGVDSTHPDLAGRLVPGWSFLTGTSNTADVLGHGTSTAGTAAAATNNATGVAGVSWGNPVMPLVALNSSNYATYSNIASAITYAADRGVRIVSISISGTSPSSTLQSAVDYAWNKGTVVFASAGNANTSSPAYPAACDKVVAVASTDSNDAKSAYSNWGSWISVAAPGNGVLTTTLGGGYAYKAGTSFSTPIVASIAALALSLRPSLSAAALVTLFEQNSDDLGTPGFDDYYGWGRVNAYRILSAASIASYDSYPPSVWISAPGNGATVSGSLNVQGTASDNVGVSRVEFYVDGSLQNTGYAPSFSFSWNSSGVANGQHTLQVKAFDQAGNVGQSSTTVNVNNFTVLSDLIPPVAFITSPANGAWVSGNSVKINVSASDNVKVSQVCIYIDGSLRYTGTSAPYSYSWGLKKAGAGLHTITAKAWDAAGNVSDTASITVTK